MAWVRIPASRSDRLLSRLHIGKLSHHVDCFLLTVLISIDILVRLNLEIDICLSPANSCQALGVFVVYHPFKGARCHRYYEERSYRALEADRTPFPWQLSVPEGPSCDRSSCHKPAQRFSYPSPFHPSRFTRDEGTAGPYVIH